jgi:hypothetical protein
MTIIVIIGLIGIGLVGFLVGFMSGAHAGFDQGFEEGRNFECAQWIMRMASPEDRRRIFGGSSSQSPTRESKTP